MPSLRLLVAPGLALGLAAQDLHLNLDRPDATWKGATLTTDGVRGAAAHFGGDRAVIDAGPLEVRDDQPFTLRLSLRTTSPGFCTPFMARAGDQVGLSFVIGREPGKVAFEAWSWPTVKLLSRHRIDDGKWHQLEVAYEPSSNTALLFVDGVLDASAALGAGGSPQAQLRLGNNVGTHQPYAGDVDEVHFARTLSHADLFARCAPAVPPAVFAAALAAYRLRLLPNQTKSLQPNALATWPARRAAVRAHVADCLGLSPEPPRGPLDVQVHGELKGDGFVVQRLSWTSFPGARASGWLWLPDPLPKGRVPAVLNPHGHFADGAIDPVVQARCIAFAKFGWIALGVDSVHVEDIAAGVSSIGTMTFDNQRGLDLLLARTDVDPPRIGCTGASGGAQQTYYLMALEDRIAAAAPMVMTCYLQNILTDSDAHCWCNHLPRLADGTDVPEMAAVFAPKPALFGSVTGDWTHDFPEHGLPELRALWTSLGQKGLPRSRHANEGHNYDQPMREVVYGFLYDTLVGPDADGMPRASVTEPPLQPLPVASLRALGGPAYRSAPDRRVLAHEMLQRRPRLASVSALAPGLPWQVEAKPIQWRGAADLAFRPATVAADDGVPIPFVVQHSEADDSTPWTVVVAEQGRAALLAAPPAWLAKAPHVVVVDPRWSGELSRFAPYWRRNGLMLGQGEGYQAAHDLALVCQSLPGKAPITLLALGRHGVTALLAAPLCPRITRLIADDLGPTYTQDGNRLPLCPELLRFGDLPALAALAAPTATCTFGGTDGKAPLTEPQITAALAAH